MIVIFFAHFDYGWGHSSSTFSLGRVGDINPVDLNHLKKPIPPPQELI